MIPGSQPIQLECIYGMLANMHIKLAFRTSRLGLVPLAMPTTIYCVYAYV